MTRFEATGAQRPAAGRADQGASFHAILTHGAAVAALALRAPLVAGALLSLSVLALKRGTPSTRLRIESANQWWRLVMDAALAGLVAVWLASTQPKAVGPTADALQLVLLAVAGIWLLTYFTRARLIPPNNTSGMAHLLLGVGLMLTPLATWLTRVEPRHWVLTALAAAGVVHGLELARLMLTHLDSSGVVRTNRLVLLGKGSALRNAAAALAATALDFGVFSLLVKLSPLAPPTATFLGAVAGGLLNFLVNRSWTFNASGSKRTMARRYVTVSGVSAVLNASLVALLLWVPNQDVTLVWLVARGLVFLGWNYPLHRDYVFGHAGESP